MEPKFCIGSCFLLHNLLNWSLLTLVDALIALHDGWLKNPTSWDTSKDPCDDGWLGIWCNDDQTRVIGMYEIQLIGDNCLFKFYIF